MGTMMVTHVDKFTGTLHALESSLEDSLGAAYECNYCAVGGFAGVHVKDFYST